MIKTKPVLRIRITGQGNKISWYRNLVDQEFDVITFGRGNLVLYEDFCKGSDVRWRQIGLADVVFVGSEDQ